MWKSWDLLKISGFYEVIDFFNFLGILFYINFVSWYPLFEDFGDMWKCGHVEESKLLWSLFRFMGTGFIRLNLRRRIP